MARLIPLSGAPVRETAPPSWRHYAVQTIQSQHQQDHGPKECPRQQDAFFQYDHLLPILWNGQGRYACTPLTA